MRDAGHPVDYFGKWHLGHARLARIDHWDATHCEEGYWIDGKESMGSPCL